MKFKKLPARESDQLLFIADNKKITKLTSWTPKTSTKEGLQSMLKWIELEK